MSSKSDYLWLLSIRMHCGLQLGRVVFVEPFRLAMYGWYPLACTHCGLQADWRGWWSNVERIKPATYGCYPLACTHCGLQFDWRGWWSYVEQITLAMYGCYPLACTRCGLQFDWRGWCSRRNKSDWPGTAAIHSLVRTAAYNSIGEVGGPMWNKSHWPCTAAIHSLVRTAAYKPIGDGWKNHTGHLRLLSNY